MASSDASAFFFGVTCDDLRREITASALVLAFGWCEMGWPNLMDNNLQCGPPFLSSSVFFLPYKCVQLNSSCFFITISYDFQQISELWRLSLENSNTLILSKFNLIGCLLAHFQLHALQKPMDRTLSWQGAFIAFKPGLDTKPSLKVRVCSAIFM